MATIMDNIRSKLRETGGRNGAGGLSRSRLAGGPVRERVQSARDAMKVNGAAGLAKNALEFPMVKKLLKGNSTGPGQDLMRRLTRPGEAGPASAPSSSASLGHGDIISADLVQRSSD